MASHRLLPTRIGAFRRHSVVPEPAGCRAAGTRKIPPVVTVTVLMSDSSDPLEKPASAFTPEENAQFMKMFGVSREELERRGINRTEFIEKRLRRVARSEKRMSVVWSRASQADRLRHQSSSWRLRSFYCLFMALGSLLVFAQHVPQGIRIISISVSCLAWLGGAISGWLGVRKYFQWLEAWRHERHVA